MQGAYHLEDLRRGNAILQGQDKINNLIKNIMFSFILSPSPPAKALNKASTLGSHSPTCFPTFRQTNFSHHFFNLSFLSLQQCGVHVLLNSVTFLQFLRHLPPSFPAHLSFFFSYTHRCHNTPPPMPPVSSSRSHATCILFLHFAENAFFLASLLSYASYKFNLPFLKSYSIFLLQVSHTYL